MCAIKAIQHLRKGKTEEEFKSLGLSLGVNFSKGIIMSIMTNENDILIDSINETNILSQNEKQNFIEKL